MANALCSSRVGSLGNRDTVVCKRCQAERPSSAFKVAFASGGMIGEDKRGGDERGVLVAEGERNFG